MSQFKVFENRAEMEGWLNKRGFGKVGENSPWREGPELWQTDIAEAEVFENGKSLRWKYLPLGEY